jgi:hypothetical protein
MNLAVEALRNYVAHHFDGSVESCMYLDNLLWEVRLSKHHEPRPSAPPSPREASARECPTPEDL